MRPPRSRFGISVLFVAVGCGHGQGDDAEPGAATTGTGASTGNGGSLASGSDTGGAVSVATSGPADSTDGASTNTTQATSSGGSGTSDSGGVATVSTGGAAGTGGAGGGAGGTPGAGGEAGTGTPEICSFDVAGAPSPAIPTVGVVDWSTDLVGLDAASIEFTLDDPTADTINRGSGGTIDIEGEVHRALMLGLKPERTYTYRIIANSGDTVCVSADQSLTTGVATDFPMVMRTAGDPSRQAAGFIVTTSWGGSAFIIDADGDVVWGVDAPSETTRARLDWEAQNLWLLDGNPAQGSVGEVRRISMDGSEVLENVAGLENAHHDLTVLPGGIVATLLWSGEDSDASDLVERAPDGSITTVARLDDAYFKPSDNHHANSLMYHELDDSYTVGDLSVATYIKLSRQGELLWQFSDNCDDAPAPKCATGDLIGNHGHHLLDDGTFLFFRSSTSTNLAYEYTLTEDANSLTASEVWSYDAGTLSSLVLGDIQRLPNGNTLVVISTEGEMHEVTPEGNVVQRLVFGGWFGYATFRESLYGPPLR